MNTDKTIEKILPLSPMQEGVLFHSITDTSSYFYFEHIIFDLEGEVKLDLLEKCFNQLIVRYQNYRSIYLYEKVAKPKQIVLKNRNLKLDFEDITKHDVSTQKQVIDNYVVKDRARGFDLTKDLLIRIKVFQLTHSLYKIVWSDHLITRDGWSFGIIAKDFFYLYQSYLQKREPLHLSISNDKYLEWLGKQKKETALEFWKEYIKGYENDSSVPKIKNVAENEYEYEEIECVLKKELTDQMTILAKENQVTLNTVFQGIWGVLLQKYNNCEDVMFGTIVSGRPSVVEDIEGMVGLFINTVPIRMNFKGTTSFEQVLRESQRMFNSSLDYQYLNIGEIQAIQKSNKNLFDHIIVFENYPLPQEMKNLDTIESCGFKVKNVDIQERTSYPLNIEVTIKESLKIKFYYNKLVYDKRILSKTFQHFIYIAEQVVSNDCLVLDEIQIINEAEEKEIIEKSNGKNSPYNGGSIVDVFKERLKKLADHQAIIEQNQMLTYKEFDDLTDVIAANLYQRGVLPGDIVAIIERRSINMILGIMGILKAGAAYLPIDIKHPRERVHYILADSGAKCVISEESSCEICQVYTINELLKELDGPTNFSKSIPAENTAYVLYTSGTTGNPKGVMISHRAAVNLLYCQEQNYSIGIEDTMLFKTPYTFDISVTEIFGWYFGEGRLCILEADMEMNPETIINYIEKYHVTHINFVPSMLHSFLNSLSKEQIEVLLGLKYVFVAGEAVSIETAHLFKKLLPRVILVNLYGPTEATVYASGYIINDIKNYGTIPIGRPLNNYSIYIVDKHNQLQPIGVEGELLISGCGLAKGYLKLEKLSREKFTKIVIGNKEIDVYRTGDVARWLPDGEIEFIGRQDSQVKVRGYRIELGEIENCLLAQPCIKEAAVVVKEGNYLCAFLVTCTDDVSDSSIIKQLEEKLPEYMIPYQIIRLTSLPKTSSGKINKKALANTELEPSVELDQFQNDTEEILYRIWLEVLGTNAVGLEQGFYYMGGHSLKAIELVSRLQKQNIQIKVSDILRLQSIRKIAKFLEQRRKDLEARDEELEISRVNVDCNKIYPKIIMQVQEKVKQYETNICCKDKVSVYTISAIQAYHLLYDEYQNSGTIMHLNFEVQIERMTQAWNDIMREQSLLRSTLMKVQGDKYIWNLRAVSKVDLPFLDLSSYDKDNQEEMIVNLMQDFFYKPFGYDDTIMYRILLVKKSTNHYMLLMPFSHLIYDYYSGEIIKSKLMEYYETLEQNRIAQSDFVPTYSDYIKQMKIGPIDINEKEIIERYNLYSFVEATNEINQSIISQKEEGNTQVTFLLGITQTQEAKNYQNAIQIVITYLASYFNVEKIPFWTIYNGRRYQNEDYSNAVGEFIDIIPNLVQPNIKYEEIKRIIQENTSTACSHNINWLTLMFQERENKDSLLQSMLKKMLEKHFILFNYQGYYDNQSFQDVGTYMDSNKITNQASKFMIEVKYSEEQLRFDLYLPFKEEKEKAETIFNHVIDELIHRGLQL